MATVGDILATLRRVLERCEALTRRARCPPFPDMPVVSWMFRTHLMAWCSLFSGSDDSGIRLTTFNLSRKSTSSLMESSYFLWSSSARFLSYLTVCMAVMKFSISSLLVASLIAMSEGILTNGRRCSAVLRMGLRNLEIGILYISSDGMGSYSIGLWARSGSPMSSSSLLHISGGIEYSPKYGRTRFSCVGKTWLFNFTNKVCSATLMTVPCLQPWFRRWNRTSSWGVKAVSATSYQCNRRNVRAMGLRALMWSTSCPTTSIRAIRCSTLVLYPSPRIRGIVPNLE